MNSNIDLYEKYYDVDTSGFTSEDTESRDTVFRLTMGDKFPDPVHKALVRWLEKNGLLDTTGIGVFAPDLIAYEEAIRVNGEKIANMASGQGPGTTYIPFERLEYPMPRDLFFYFLGYHRNRPNLLTVDEVVDMIKRGIQRA